MNTNVLDRIRVKFGNNVAIRGMLDPFNQIIRKYFQIKMNHNFRKYGLCVFDDFVDKMNQANFRYWPEFGTLLGIYRENDFIPYDDDFDFGAFVEDRDAIYEFLTKNGYCLKHSFYCPDLNYIKEDTFVKNGIGIDVFYFSQGLNCDCCYTFIPFLIDKNNHMQYKIKVFSFAKIALEPIVFKGKTLYIPRDTREHLVVSYGESFMIPDPNFKSLNNDYIENVFAYQL